MTTFPPNLHSAEICAHDHATPKTEQKNDIMTMNSSLSQSTDTPNTLAQISGIIQRCSSHMDLATVQHKAVVALFHKTTCLLVSDYAQAQSLMTSETETT